VNKTHQDSTTPDLSRRSLLQSAAGAGLAVTAAATLGVAATAATHVNAPSAASATPDNAAASADKSLVVHVRDIKTGDIEVFSGTNQTRVRDRALAARIAKAIS
jgi:predicted nicotinamide N-methyase